MPRRPKVYLRIRPSIRLEEKNDSPLLLVDAENHIVKYQKPVGNNLNECTEAQAKFDIVFDSCNQEEVFNQLWDEIFTGFQDGINTSIILYGATGSGKTFTMEGNVNESINVGIFPRFISRIFEFCDDNAKSFIVTLAYIELYNNRIDDLLSLKRNIECSSNTLNNHAKKVEIKSAEHFMECFKKASKSRKTAVNKVHDKSSRSHSIAQITVTWEPMDAEVSKISVFNFVDLAGAERYDIGTNPTESDRLRQEECTAINQGLTQLSRVVAALVERSSKDSQVVIPFRDHKLSKLLSSSLTGDCALMLILCTPNICSQRLESCRTIDFGLRCLKLSTKPKVNKVSLKSSTQDFIKSQKDVATTLDDNKAMIGEEKEEYLDMIESAIQQPPANKDEIAILKKTLDDLRCQLAEKEAKLFSLSGVDANLATALSNLEELRRHRDVDRNLITNMEEKVEERESRIQSLLNLNQELDAKLRQMAQEEQNLIELRLQLESLQKTYADSLARGNNNSQVQEAVLRLKNKESEVNELKRTIAILYALKNSAESRVSTFRLLLEKRFAAQSAYEEALRVVQNLEIRIHDIHTVVNSSSNNSDSGSTTIDSNTSMAFTTSEGSDEKPSNWEKEELKYTESVLQEELHEAKLTAARDQKFLHDLMTKIEYAVEMLPKNIQEVALAGMAELDSNTTIIKELKQKEDEVNAELARVDLNYHSYNNNDIDGHEMDVGQTTLNSFENTNKKKVIPARVTGKDLGKDLKEMSADDNIDELTRFLKYLPQSAFKLAKFLSVYESMLPHFILLDGIAKLAKNMEKAKYPSTFASLCYLLEVVAYDDKSVTQILNSTIISTIFIWFGKESWEKESEIVLVNVLDSVAKLGKYETTRARLNSGCVLAVTVRLIISNGVQKVIAAACGCLTELSPTADQIALACDGDTSIVNELCGRLIVHFHNKSISCRIKAAVCVANLSRQSQFKNIFMNTAAMSIIIEKYFSGISTWSVIDHILNRLGISAGSKDDSDQNGFAMAFLSLCESDNIDSSSTNSIDATTYSRIYEALSRAHAMRAATDSRLENLHVTGTSVIFPYSCRVLSGSWRFKSSPYTDGGLVDHGLFLRNPMYKLKLSKSSTAATTTGKSINVAITLTNLDPSGYGNNSGSASVGGNSDNDLSLQRASFAYVCIVPMSAIKEESSTNITEFAILQQLQERLFVAGQKPFFSVGCIEKSHQIASSKEASSSFQLDIDEVYILVPYKNVRLQERRFTLAVVANADILLEELSDNLSRTVYNGIIRKNEFDPAGQFTGFEGVEWRNFPQLIIESSTSLSTFYAVLSYKDRDDTYDQLWKYDDEMLTIGDAVAPYKSRPKFVIALCETSGIVGRRYVDQFSTRVASNYYVGTTCFVQAPLEPNKKYNLVIGCKGECIEEALPYRLQIYTSESNVKFSTLNATDEWYTFDKIIHVKKCSNPFDLFTLTQISSPLSIMDFASKEHQIMLNIQFLSKGEDFSFSNLRLTEDDLQLFPNIYRKSSNDDVYIELFTTLKSELKYDDNSQMKSLTGKFSPRGKAGVSDEWFTFRVFGYSSILLQLTTIYETQISPIDIEIKTNNDSIYRTFLQKSIIPLKSRLNFSLLSGMETEVKQDQYKPDEVTPIIRKKVWVDVDLLGKVYRRIAELELENEEANTSASKFLNKRLK